MEEEVEEEEGQREKVLADREYMKPKEADICKRRRQNERGR